MDILLVQAMAVLNLLSSERMIEVGGEALEAGMDSKALRILASLIQDEVAEAPELFEQASKELCLPKLSRSAAASIYAIAISRQILNGVISPQDGANKIWDASIRVNEPTFHDLDTFIYSASEIQSRPEDKDFFNSEIIKEAELWALKRSDVHMA